MRFDNTGTAYSFNLIVYTLFIINVIPSRFNRSNSTVQTMVKWDIIG